MSEERLGEVERRLTRLERAVFPLETPHPYPQIQPIGHVDQCPVCALKIEGGMGYVCPSPNCPTQPRAT